MRNLVGIAPDGRMAGFCIGWLAPEQHAVQIEPAGVDPEFQRLGLGRALMFELFQRCKALGVERVFVETDSGRWSARHAYEAVGLRPAYQSLRKGKLFSTAQGTSAGPAGPDGSATGCASGPRLPSEPRYFLASSTWPWRAATSG